MADDIFVRDSNNQLAVNTVVSTEANVPYNYDDCFTLDTNNRRALRVVGSGGDSVDYSKTVQKTDTMPTADSSNVGQAFMYSGATDSTYTTNYIYKNVESTEYSSTVEFNPASISSTTVTCSGDDFAELVAEYGSGNITDIIKGTLTYDESGELLIFVGLDDTDTQVCTFQLYTQDYIDAGFTFTGTLEDGDVIAFTTTITESSSYSWVRIDVQPDNKPIMPATMPELTVAGWSSNTQTVNVTGVTATNVVFVSPAPASAADYASAGIICTAQGAGTLTFTCTDVPSNAITVNVVCL